MQIVFSIGKFPDKRGVTMIIVGMIDIDLGMSRRDAGSVARFIR